MAAMMRLERAEALLELVRPYTAKDVSSSYRKKSRLFHPDFVKGKEEEFKDLTEARKVADEFLKKPQRTQSRVKPRSEESSGQSEEWRQRQHRPWNAHDKRSREHAASGASFVGPPPKEEAPPDEDDDSPAVELGDHIRILRVFVGIEEVEDACTWTGQIVQRNQRVLIAFQPPVPLERFEAESVLCLFTLRDDDEVLSLEGVIVERCHDRRGYLSMFCADLLS